MALTITKNMLQADQWWQSTEIAYSLVYGLQSPGHHNFGTAVPTNQPLPWEWRQEYELRTIVFPQILTIPLRVLKILRLDTNWAVINAPLLVHCFYLIITDCYFVKLGHKTVGKKATSIAMVLYLCGSLFNQ